MAKKNNTSNNRPNSKGKGKAKAKNADPKEVDTLLPTGLKILVLLSFVGFIYCLVADTGDYFTYSNYHELEKSADQTAFEVLETRLAEFEKNDIDITDAGLQKLALASIYRTIIDVLAMVGTALMYFRIKRGFYIYGFFQLLYVIIPFAMFGIGAMVIYEKIGLVPPLIYLILFTTQFKHLNR